MPFSLILDDAMPNRHMQSSRHEFVRVSTLSERFRYGVGRILANSVVTWLQIVGVTLAKLLTTPFLLNALGAENFGSYAAATSIALLTSFLTGAMQATSLRAIALEAKDADSRGKLFNALLGLHLWTAVCVLLIGYSLGSWVVAHLLVVPEDVRSTVQVVFLITLGTAAFGTLLAPYEAYLQYKERFAVFAFLDLARSWLLVPVSYGLMYYDGQRMIIYATIMAASTILTNLVGMAVVLYDDPLTRPRPTQFFNPAAYRKHGAIFSWSLVGSLSAVARNQGLTVLMNVLGGPTASAAFAIGNQMQGALRQLASSIQVVLAPRVYSKEASGDRNEMVGAALAACRISTLVAVALAVPLVVEMPTVLLFWLGDMDPTIAFVARILILSQLVDQTSVGAGMANMAMGQVGRFQSIAGGLSLLVLPLGYGVGVLTGDFRDALGVSVIVVGIVVVARILLLQSRAPGIMRRWGIETLSRVAFASVPPTVIAIAVASLLPPSLSRLALTIAVTSAVFGVSAYWLGLSAKERAMLAGLVSRVNRQS
ncbi:lipopolysaccharide biosynthesis protein [Oryzicola mucosus]|uniref:Lipopolysaccharide biosynthesis protein n=1 Tax=Oryzicola mucosus TaxID=2767425 RepID=A0A8J6PSU7_9HYPH|nr:hypothetical protein [Oryzicola mucosus]MBD0413476.1 hypothetical protein [Oryzicola mucosus]